jgi:hypothetical protein
MASQVLSGSSNVSYTNNTGQNVRIVINFMSTPSAINWAGVSVTINGLTAIGRNLATVGSISSNNSFSTSGTTAGAPTELMLAPGQTFSASCGPYNIVVIPEAG